VILARGPLIAAEALPVWQSAAPTPPRPVEERLVSLDTVEREHIVHILRKTGHNKSRAARILGIARRTLDRKIEEYGLDDLSPGGAN
jgi:DNA-binding NtrC family response regulator